MSYNVKLRDGKVYSLSEEDGFDLKSHIAEAKGTIMVELDDDLVRSSAIQAITRERITAADLPTFSTDRQVAAGPKCHGQYSIQREINKIIESEGRGWAKKIADKSYRKKIYDQLREQPGVKWCDGKTSECYCE